MKRLQATVNPLMQCSHFLMLSQSSVLYSKCIAGLLKDWTSNIQANTHKLAASYNFAAVSVARDILLKYATFLLDRGCLAGTEQRLGWLAGTCLQSFIGITATQRVKAMGEVCDVPVWTMLHNHVCLSWCVWLSTKIALTQCSLIRIIFQPIMFWIQTQGLNMNMYP